MHNVNYKLLSTSEIIVDGAPAAVLNVELICDYALTPWCDHKYAAAQANKAQANKAQAKKKSQKN